MFDFFKKKKKVEDFDSSYNEKTGALRFQTNEEVSAKSVKMQLDAFSEVSGIPTFKGKVDNAYESDFLGYKDKCPLCATPTKQMYTGLVYATQIATRIMTAPAGYFCPNCPTVIIDDEIIEPNINPQFQYGGVVGFEAAQKDPILFKTLNGVKSTYVMDADGGIGGIVSSVHMIKHKGDTFMSGGLGGFDRTKSVSAQNQKSKNLTKNRKEKKSRSQNRKK